MATVYCAEGFQFVAIAADIVASLNNQLGSTNCASDVTLFEPQVDPYGVSRQILKYGGQSIDVALDATPASICVAGQFRLDQLVSTRIIEIYDGATRQCYVSFVLTGSNHVLTAYRGDGSLLGTATASATMVGQWHQVSMKATVGELGAVSAYLDGALVLNLTGVDTRMNTADQMTKVRLYSDNSYTWLCDLVVSDDHFANGVRVITQSPNADGDDSAWSRSAGAANYQTLDDLPRNATDYIYSSTVAAENSVKVPALAVSGTVHSVIDQIYARKSNADTRQIKQFVKSGTKSYGSAITLGGTSAIYARKMDLNPVDSSAWVAADFGATGAQFGVRLET